MPTELWSLQLRCQRRRRKKKEKEGKKGKRRKKKEKEGKRRKKKEDGEESTSKNTGVLMIRSAFIDDKVSICSIYFIFQCVGQRSG